MRRKQVPVLVVVEVGGISLYGYKDLRFTAVRLVGRDSMQSSVSSETDSKDSVFIERAHY